MSFEQPPSEENREIYSNRMTTVRTVCRTDDKKYKFFAEVYFAPDPHSGKLTVTGIGPAMKGSEKALSDLRGLVGKEFNSRQELNIALHGNEEEV